jgi:glutathione synthase/RimK-type ligase-like ATP-grasp enzyme
MTSKPSVLIVSTVADVATDHVVKLLTARSIEHWRLNTEDFPFSRTMAFGVSPETTTFDFQGAGSQAPTAVWYRRMRSPAKPTGMQEGIYDFCLQENRAALLGSLMAFNSRWMSHPAAVWQAELKPLQLAVAARLGMPIPRTVITNDKDAIRRAFRQFGPLIAKPARTGHVTYNGGSHAIFTSRLLEQDLDELDGAELSPAIYQELVPKRFDIRVTVVGRRLFSAAIDSQSDPQAAIDWRHTTNPELPHHPIDLPDSVANSILKMMDQLGLTFGAVDLVQRDDGTYVFLEVNPNGQWLWIDDKLGLGISEAVADWLSET